MKKFIGVILPTDTLSRRGSYRPFLVSFREGSPILHGSKGRGKGREGRGGEGGGKERLSLDNEGP